MHFRPLLLKKKPIFKILSEGCHISFLDRNQGFTVVVANFQNTVRRLWLIDFSESFGSYHLSNILKLFLTPLPLENMADFKIL